MGEKWERQHNRNIIFREEKFDNLKNKIIIGEEKIFFHQLQEFIINEDKLKIRKEPKRPVPQPRRIEPVVPVQVRMPDPVPPRKLVPVQLPEWRGEEPQAPNIPEAYKIKQKPDYSYISRLIQDVPQVQDGRLRYVITGGYAVQMLVEANNGIARIDHHDLDLIVLTKDKLPRHDNWGLGNYVGALFFDEEMLVREFSTVVTLTKRRLKILGNKKLDVFVTTPEFLIISKMLGFGRQPRPQDIVDIRDLLQYCPIDFEKLQKAASLARFREYEGDEPRAKKLAEDLMKVKDLPFEEQAKMLRRIAQFTNPFQVVARDNRRLVRGQ